MLGMLAGAIYRGINRTCRISEEGHLTQAENVRESFLVEVMPNLNVEGKLNSPRRKKGKSRARYT